MFGKRKTSETHYILRRNRLTRFDGPHRGLKVKSLSNPPNAVGRLVELWTTRDNPAPSSIHAIPDGGPCFDLSV